MSDGIGARKTSIGLDKKKTRDKRKVCPRILPAFAAFLFAVHL